MVGADKGIRMKEFRDISLLSDELAGRYRSFHLARCLAGSGYDDPSEWHQPISEDFGVLPKADMQRVTIYKADETLHSYSHITQICKLRDKYFLAWSNGLRHEDEYGQEIRYSVSDNGIDWAEYKSLTVNPPENRIAYASVGVAATDDCLVVYCRRGWDLKAAAEGMVPHERKTRLDAFVTRDLKNWQTHEDVLANVSFFEGPRLTSAGRLMCCGYERDKGSIAVFWDTKNPWVVEEIVPMPAPQRPAGLTCGEATWCQNTDGRIWMFSRDEAQSLRLYTSWSDDQGKTWQDLMITDIPDSMSRASAGTLTDGRCYLVNNAYPRLLWRKYLMLSIRSDGDTFDKMYLLADEPTTRRIKGRHKEDGYQYPHTLVDGDKLFVAYSVNKEDIEIGIIDATRL